MPRKKTTNQPWVMVHPVDKTKYELKYPLYIGSIDIGIKNFAFRIEKRISETETEPLFFDLQNFNSQNIITEVTPATLNQLSNWLNTLEIMKVMDLLIIEKQVGKNVIALQLESYLLGYMTARIKYADPCYSLNKELVIISINPKLKGRMLGAPKSLVGKQIKLWAQDKAIEILTARQELWSLSVIGRNKKKDDLCDTIVQLEAFILWMKNGELN